MTGRWASSNRRAELPSDWAQRRVIIFVRDDWTCVDCGHRDETGATLECDHTGDRHDHRHEVLATRCVTCHGRRTQQQAAAARAARPTRNRPTPRHPGLR